MTTFPALHATLRAETGAHHARLGGTPYVSALRAGTMPPLAALSFLRGLAIVHAGHERLPRLITSAWVDERPGIEGALGATQGWFEDPHRFSPEWASEVRRLRASLDAGC